MATNGASDAAAAAAPGAEEKFLFTLPRHCLLAGWPSLDPAKWIVSSSYMACDLLY